MNPGPSLILINPWIHDFAAYDFWSRPLGLLCVAGFLRERGCRIQLIDCLDVHHPMMTGGASQRRLRRRLYGTGKYWREVLPRPPCLPPIGRPYSRYGLSPHLVERELRGIPTPSAILITSLMTYWYPGVQEAIRLTRRVHPRVPVILGGIYARLCRDHAVATSGADCVVSGPGFPSVITALRDCGVRVPEGGAGGRSDPYPAFDLLTRMEAVSILTSVGCPYRCDYCASHYLYPDMRRRDPEAVVREIAYWHRKYGVRDFAFYDDALLTGFERHAGPILEGVARLGLDCRFHTPNALHVREITREAAALMRRTGFHTIRLGLESSAMPPHRNLDRSPGAISRGPWAI